MGESGDGAFAADVVQETLSRSSLEGLADGGRVNLELPLRATDRLGGHVVQGHVDGLGRVEAIADEGFSKRITIAAGPELLRYVVEKGSIAVDGISLTVAALGETLLRHRPDPRDARAHDAGSRDPRRSRQPRSRCPGQVR